MEVTNPTSLDEITVKKLEEAFAMDCSVSQACLLANISRGTYYNWVESFPAMKERFEQLRETLILKARTTIRNNIDIPEHAKWYLERKAKKEFAQRSEVTGSEGGPVQTITGFDYVMPEGETKTHETKDKTNG